MPDVMKRQRETRRKIIRQWMRLSKDKRQSINEISAFAKIHAQTPDGRQSRRRAEARYGTWGNSIAAFMRVLGLADGQGFKATLILPVSCPYRKSNPLAVDRESGDAAARCLICANLSLEQ